MRYFIHLAYNGSDYFGWQIQPEQKTVQETLEKCLSSLLHHERIPITGCGRTDTGVHASCFYAHFDINEEMDAQTRSSLKDKLNSFLPKDIVIYDIIAVNDNAHARFDAQERTYQYFVTMKKDPFNYMQRLYFHPKLDIDKMNEAAAILLQNEDFTSFSKVHTQVNNFICDVTYAHWERRDGVLIFTITANRFLRNMVRAIVGTLLDVGRNRISIDDFQEIIKQKNRCKASTSVSACALFLTNVRYNWVDLLPR
mgnify:CR=1 FL=1